MPTETFQVDNTIVILWSQPVLATDVRAAQHEVMRLVRSSGGAKPALISVIEPDVEPPDAANREEMQRINREIIEYVLCNYYVVESRGFLAARVMNSITVAFMNLSLGGSFRSAGKQLVCRTVREALVKARALDSALDVERVEAAIEDRRRAAAARRARRDEPTAIDKKRRATS